MHSIRQNYGSTSPSDSDSDDDFAHDGLSAPPPPHGALPPAPTGRETPAHTSVTVAEVAVPLTGRARPSTTLDDAHAFCFHPYQSKRRRRLGGSADAPEAPRPVAPPTEAAFVFDGVQEAARGVRRRVGRSPGRLEPAFRLSGHRKAVSALRWNPRFPALALSASMDATVRVWDASRYLGSSSGNDCSRRVLRLHSAALGVKSAAWSLDGRHALSGGYDGRAVYFDVETGAVLSAFAAPSVASRPGRVIEAVTSVCVHPTDSDWVVVGTSRGGIHSVDLRAPSGRPALSFSRSFAHVHDMLFLPPDAGGGADLRLVSSADVTRRRDARNQTLLVWDFRSAALLFDRLDPGLHALQCLRRHPTRAQFVAQSAGGPVALFSALAPYKRVKTRSFAGGHEVVGYPVQCSFSPDGALLATGDARGRLVLYSDASGAVAQSRRLRDARTPVLAVDFNPAGGREAALAAGSYDGGIDVLRFEDHE